MARSVNKQSSFERKKQTVSANDNYTFTYKTNMKQAVRVFAIDVRAPPLCTVEIKYNDENGNQVTFPTKYQFEMPHKFKHTATGNPLIVTSTQPILITVENPYNFDITAQMNIEFTKIFLDGGE